MELFLITIAWLFGILSGLYFKLGIVLFVIVIIFLCTIKKKNKYLKFFCLNRYIIICILCYIISYFQITWLEKSFNEKYQNIEKEIQVIGTIVSNPLNKEYKTSYTIKVESINGDTSYQNTKLLLHVKKEKGEMHYSYGNKISFIGEWEEPAGQRNEGAFNYKQYLKTKNIYGIVTTNKKNIEVKKEKNSNIILKLANIVANKIEEKANCLLEKQEASILTAILIGKKENLEEEVKEVFRNSSLSHMLAISGAHVSYVIMGIGFLIEKTKIGKKTGKIITIMLLLFFMLMTGQTLSVTRACLMVIYRILASLFYKRVSILPSISISIFILMLINPYCIFDVGLQLSYGGTIGIVLFYQLFQKIGQKKEKKGQKGIKKHLQKTKIKIQEILKISLSANIILFPIILYHFNTLSFTFLISNVLATPIMGVLVIVGFITIIFSFVCGLIGEILILPLQFFIKLFLQIAVFTSKLPFSKIYLATPKLSSIFLYYLAIFLFFLYQKRNKKKRRIEKKTLQKVKQITKKKIIAILLIFITLTVFYQQIPKNLRIYFIDVGQGDSTLIITPKEKTILIDGGGARDNNSFDVGKNLLMPYLLDRGITKIDYVLISHFDSDHVGGLLYVIENMKVNKIIISKQGKDSENYQAFKKIVRKKKIEVMVVKKRRGTKY